MFAKVNTQLFVAIGGGICRNQGNNIFIFQATQRGDIHVDKRREFAFNKPRDKQRQGQASYALAFRQKDLGIKFAMKAQGLFIIMADIRKLFVGQAKIRGSANNLYKIMGKIGVI